MHDSPSLALLRWRHIPRGVPSSSPAQGSYNIMATLKGSGVLLATVALLAGVWAAHAGRTASTEKIKTGRRSEDQPFISGVSSALKQPVKNAKPLIGIMTQPCHECPGKSYIAAGFVKWIESAGGRAVPIRFYASDDELHRIFNSINGIIFPGGLTWLWLDSPYVIAARKLFNWALQANDAGDPFPIHGTCLGFQLLHILASNVSRNHLLVDTDSVTHATTLEYVGQAANASALFGGLAPHMKEAMTSSQYNIVLQNHMYGLPPDMYNKYPDLAQWYNILSTSKDRNGTVYVSTIEGKKYPFTGTQWHPEKPPFEFGMEEVPHSIEAITVSQHLANVFIETARRSSHKPESKEQELALEIYDTCPIFSLRFETTDEDNYDGPDMTYYFDNPEKPPSGPDDDGQEGLVTEEQRVMARHPGGFFLG